MPARPKRSSAQKVEFFRLARGGGNQEDPEPSSSSILPKHANSSSNSNSNSSCSVCGASSSSSSSTSFFASTPLRGRRSLKEALSSLADVEVGEDDPVCRGCREEVSRAAAAEDELKDRKRRLREAWERTRKAVKKKKEEEEEASSFESWFSTCQVEVLKEEGDGKAGVSIGQVEDEDEEEEEGDVLPSTVATAKLTLSTRRQFDLLFVSELGLYCGDVNEAKLSSLSPFVTFSDWKGRMTLDVRTKEALEAEEKVRLPATPAGRFHCLRCLSHHTSFSEVMAHLAGAHGGRGGGGGGGGARTAPRHDCRDCGRGFRALGSLIRHRKKSHLTRPPPSKPSATKGTNKSHCDQCNRSFNDPAHAEAHFRTHRGEVPFECKVCGKGFTRKASALEHAARHEGRRERECQICHKRFYSTSYWRHMSSVHAPAWRRVHACPAPGCGRAYAQHFRLTAHLAMAHVAHADRAFACRVCPERRFATLARLRSHFSSVHRGRGPDGTDEGFFCARCGMVLEHAGGADGHVHRERKKPLECGDCQTTFSSRALLERHRQIHRSGGGGGGGGRGGGGPEEEEEEAVIAEQPTPVSSATEGDGEETPKKASGPPGILLPSPQAQSQVLDPRPSPPQAPPPLSPPPPPQQQQQGQQEQQQEHQEHKQHDDQEQQHQLLALQTSEGSFLLPIDPLTTERILTEVAAAADTDGDGRDLGEAARRRPKGEQLISGEDRPAVSRGPRCEVCGKDFKSDKAKKAHLRDLHSTSGPFRCPECPKTFASRRYLGDHAKTHVAAAAAAGDGGRRFCCGVCGAAFAMERYLRRHSRIHSAEKPYKCRDCGRSFSATSNLSEHRRNVHKKDRRGGGGGEGEEPTTTS